MFSPGVRTWIQQVQTTFSVPVGSTPVIHFSLIHYGSVGTGTTVSASGNSDSSTALSPSLSPSTTQSSTNDFGGTLHRRILALRHHQIGHRYLQPGVQRLVKGVPAQGKPLWLRRVRQTARPLECSIHLPKILVLEISSNILVKQEIFRGI